MKMTPLQIKVKQIRDKIGCYPKAICPKCGHPTPYSGKYEYLKCGVNSCGKIYAVDINTLKE
jgi:hypothetical protein